MAYIQLTELEAVIDANRPDLTGTFKDLEDTHIEFASNYLDSLDWAGYRADASQANAWPRSYVPIDRFNVSLGYQDSSDIPLEIKLIVAELAIRYHLNPGITGDSSSGIAVTGVTLPDSNPDVLGDYLRSRIKVFLRNTGGLHRVN